MELLFHNAILKRPATRRQAAALPEFETGLSRVGVTGVQKTVRMLSAGSEALVPATIDCSLDVDPLGRMRMSQLPELFEEAIDETVIGEKLRIERLAEHIASHIVERQRAMRAEVKIVARYPVDRLTPVTGLPTQELVTLIGIAAVSPASSRRVVGVGAAGINACPRAQALVRSQAARRLAARGFGSADVERILALVPLATHDQRGRGEILLGTELRLDAEELVDIVQSSMSARIYELLKRPDELAVVEDAHAAPRSVEDSVRLMVKGVLDSYPALDDGDFVHARQVNVETIHNHDVVAERFGTVGELRRERSTGEPAPRQTELRDWLRA